MVTKVGSTHSLVSIVASAVMKSEIVGNEYIVCK